MHRNLGLVLIVVLSLLHSFSEVDGFRLRKSCFTSSSRLLFPRSEALSSRFSPKIVSSQVTNKRSLFASVELSSNNQDSNNLGFFKKVWNVTFGWIISWFSRIISKFIFRKKTDTTPDSHIESIAIMKDIAKEDEKKEVRDDVIIVSASVPIPIVDSPITVAATTSTENKELGLEQARKIVEKKLKEIEEQRKQQKQVSDAAVLAATTIDGVPIDSSFSNQVNPIVEEDSSGLQTQSSESFKFDVAVESMSSSDTNNDNAVDLHAQTSTPIIQSSPSAIENSAANEGSNGTLVEPEAESSFSLSSIFPKSDLKFTDFKSKGVSGVIAYIITEFGFWTIYPLLLFLYNSSTGDSLNGEMTQGSTAQLIGLSAIFITIARFAVPLRFGLAFSLIPWVEENITKKFLQDFKFGEEEEKKQDEARETESNRNSF